MHWYTYINANISIEIYVDKYINNIYRYITCQKILRYHICDIKFICHLYNNNNRNLEQPIHLYMVKYVAYLLK